MQSRVAVTIALVAAALAVGAASISHYTRAKQRDQSVASAHVGPLTGIANGRVWLTDEEVNQTRNPKLWPTPVRSLLSVDHTMKYGEWIWNDRDVPPGPATIRIDLKTQLISVVRGGHEIGTAVILYGAQSHETPIGRFPILSKNATYRSRAYDAPMPYAMRLTADGVALHGSDVLSGRATHGCIGLPLEFARKLFQQAEKGDEVMILRS